MPSPTVYSNTVRYGRYLHDDITIKMAESVSRSFFGSLVGSLVAYFIIMYVIDQGYLKNFNALGSEATVCNDGSKPCPSITLNMKKCKQIDEYYSEQCCGSKDWTLAPGTAYYSSVLLKDQCCKGDGTKISSCLNTSPLSCEEVKTQRGKLFGAGGKCSVEKLVVAGEL